MCALVLALRKVPIYAPGGGGATLGSVDQPTYSVAVSDEQAAAARANFDKTKSGKHMKSSKTSKPSVDLGFSSGVSSFATDDATLRGRSTEIGSKSEQSALNALNARSPASDAAHNWQMVDEPNSPTRKPIPGSDQRSQDIREVYETLHRQNTRGRRRESNGTGPQSHTAIPVISEQMEQAVENNNRPRRQDSYGQQNNLAPRYEYASGSSLGLHSPTGGFPVPPQQTAQGSMPGQIRTQQPPTAYAPGQAPPNRPDPGRGNSFAPDPYNSNQRA